MLKKCGRRPTQVRVSMGVRTYPMPHLLREEGISRVAAEPNDLLEIPRRNIETLRSLGKDRILKILCAIEPVFRDEPEVR